jgi:acyl-CoA dehydrogenase
MLQRVAAADTSVVARARAIAQDVARPNAAGVDREGRFPAEAVAAMRAAGLLGAAIPCALGGGGASIADIAAACHELGQGCSNAAMVFAMHQIQVACLVRHAGASPWHADFLRRVAAGQLLLASATTEAGTGGDVRRSDCAVVGHDGLVEVGKEGCVISYAANADAVLVTARRSPDAPATDQVLLVAERGQCVLEPVSGWDTLGMRGTDSRTWRLSVRADAGQIMPVPYAEISALTMLPVSHITWAALWLGIATGAATIARAVLRDRARRQPNPPAAARLAELLTQLQGMRAGVAEATRRYQAGLGDADALGSIGFVLAMNALKISTSTQAVQIIGQAMQVVGLAAYRNDSPHSLGRHLRDAHSAALMIGNDRILTNSAALLAAYRSEEPLFA